MLAGASQLPVTGLSSSSQLEQLPDMVVQEGEGRIFKAPELIKDHFCHILLSK